MTSPGALPLVLVAEDEDSVRQMLGLALKAIGYQTVLYPDGAAAAEAIDSGTLPDIVVLDVRMPRMNGIDLVRHIRANQATANTPVVAMSAYSDELQAREMLEAGANAFLAKPFTIEELRTTMQAVAET